MYNANIQADRTSIPFSRFFELSIMFHYFLVKVASLRNGINLRGFLVKKFNELRENCYFQWLKLIRSIPERWKFIIKKNYEKAANLIIHGHYLTH